MKPLESVISRRQCLALGAGLVAAPWAQAELTDIRQRGALKVAVYKNNLPFSDAGAQGVSGVDAELAQALAQRLQLAVQWLPFEAGENMGDDLRNMVWKGHYLGYGPADLMMQVPIDRHLIAETPQVNFLMPYYRHRFVWLTKGTPSVKDLHNMSLDGVSMAAEVSSAAGAALMGYEGGRFKQSVRLLTSGLEAAQGVVQGKWQAAYVTQAQAEAALIGVANRQDHVIEPAALRGTPNNGWAVGLAVKAKQPELASALGLALKGLTDDGTLARIWSKHGLTLLSP